MGEERKVDFDGILSGEDAGNSEQPTEGDETGASESSENPQEATGEQESETEQPTTSATPDAEDNEGKKVPLAALTDERRKRQEAEERVRESERKLAYLEGRESVNAPNTEPKKEHEWTEEEIMDDVPGAFKKLESRAEARERETRFRMSDTMARRTFDDYEQVMSKDNMAAVSARIPGFNAMVEASSAPCIDAYDAIKAQMERDAAPKTSKEEMEAEIQKRVDARIAELQGDSVKNRIPTSLSGARGSGAGTAEATAWKGPTSFGDMFKSKC